MKKNVLALSIAAMIGGLGFAGAASADVVVGATPLTATNATSLSFAEGGVGHALLVPYFNAQNGNMTVLHVVNTDTSRGKAVKVRFRGAQNSDDILDFQVFMSPGDVWTAAVTAGSDGVAQLQTADGTCTLPALAKNVPQRFVTDRLNQGLATADLANQTREGYVEIFNMADIPATLAGSNTTNPLYTAIKHVNGVAPCTSSALNATLQNFTTPAAVAAAGFDTPPRAWSVTGTSSTWRKPRRSLALLRPSVLKTAAHPLSVTSCTSRKWLRTQLRRTTSRLTRCSVPRTCSTPLVWL